MKAKFLLLKHFAVLMLASLASGPAAWAQGPTIDPTFQATAVYKPATVTQVVQQPDGRRLVLGGSVRAGNQPAGRVVRLLANSNQPDSVFTSNVRGLQGGVKFMVLLPNGKVLLAGYSQLTLGTVSRTLLLLNADGTADAGFNANLITGTDVINAVGQADGKVVLVSRYALLRLLPNGAVDAAFQTAFNNSGTSNAQMGNNVVLQADGKLLVPGNFNGRGVLRLLPTGALDATFTAPATVNLTYLASQVTVQANGSVLVTFINNSGTATLPALVRLTDTGAMDPTFQPAVRGSFGTAFPPGAQVQVQPDGRLLISGYLTNMAGAPISRVVRLLPGGGLDASFDATASVGTITPNNTQLLPNGQILAVATVLYSGSSPVNQLVLLNPDGSPDPSLMPRLFALGQVNDVVQLPTGGYLVGGDFTEINGVAAGFLARLSAAGVPDPTFPAMADGMVRSLLVQPDGKLLVGGDFGRIAGSNRFSLARLLPSGALDVAFAPPFLPTPLSSTNGITRIAILPDGRVLTAGTTQLTSTGNVEPWLRLLDATTGHPDLSIPQYQATDMVVQPNGKVVVAGFSSNGTPNLGFCLFRLLPSGALDPAFASIPSFRSGFGGGPIVSALAQDAVGNLFLTAGYYIDAGPPTPPFLGSLQPDGQPIASVSDVTFGGVNSLAVQPNGRLLVGHVRSGNPLAFGVSRVLSNLTPDPSFLSANGPALGVSRLLVQPDGAIMVAGSFTSVGSQPIVGLVRLLDAHVLRVNGGWQAARTQAWPVPAHGHLHLSLDAASQPQRIELLDALGRVAVSQPVIQPNFELSTSALPAGVYLLRVQYATGSVVRRVVLE